MITNSAQGSLQTDFYGSTMGQDLDVAPGSTTRPAGETTPALLVEDLDQQDRLEVEARLDSLGVSGHPGERLFGEARKKSIEVVQSLEEGQPVARLQIPNIEVDFIVVSGVSRDALRLGPGWYRSSSLPGQKVSNNFAVAGHRTTYGAPFNRIGELVPGDVIVADVPWGRFVYEVIDVDGDSNGNQIVAPEDVAVVGDFGDSRITLTACHPIGSAAERIVVVGEMVWPHNFDGSDVLTPVIEEEHTNSTPVEVLASPIPPSSGSEVLSGERGDQSRVLVVAAILIAALGGLVALGVGMLLGQTKAWRPRHWLLMGGSAIVCSLSLNAPIIYRFEQIGGTLY